MLSGRRRRLGVPYGRTRIAPGISGCGETGSGAKVVTSGEQVATNANAQATVTRKVVGKIEATVAMCGWMAVGRGVVAVRSHLAEVG